MSNQHTNTTADQEHLAARRILAVTEEELQQIVLCIHDGPVQRMFAALAQISAIKKQRTQGVNISKTDYDEHFARLSHLLETALSEIRNFLGMFRSPDFTGLDLVDMIQGLVIQHEALTSCQIKLTVCESHLPVALPVKIALYRICQEALSNAYRHSGTKQQQVQLDRQDNVITMTISDKGRGFVPPPLSGPDATERLEHIGLRGMRERVGLIGGEFELRSTPGSGTQIVVRVLANE